MTKKRVERGGRGDLERRIAKLKRQVRRRAGGKTVSWESDELSGEQREAIWRQVLEFAEPEAQVRLLDLLTERGVALPEPETMTNEALFSKLWEVVNALAEMRVCLLSTDHLTDRELYTALCRNILLEESDPPPQGEGGMCYVDLLGTGSETDIYLYLKHFADEDWRKSWQADFPDYEMPAHEDPPCDRDRHLPSPTGPGWDPSKVSVASGSKSVH
jgi:hypothetical protein